MASERLQVILELITGQYKREAKEAATATGRIGDSATTASGQVGIFGKNTANVGKALSGLATGALLTAGVGLLKFGSDSVKAASTLEESMNAVKVVFGEAAGTITEFGEEAAVSAGLAQSEFQQMASVLGSALINAGIPLDEAADKTIELAQRAADMASVFNTTVPDALGAMQAALRGESDPIEKYGVTLSEAAVNAEAVALGFKKVAGTFTTQEKAAARLSLIMKQTDRVAGDFANTSDGLANKSKILSARFTDLQADIGQGLIPLVLDAIDALEPLLDVFGFLAEKITEVDDAVNEGHDAPSKWAQAWAVASDIGKGAIFGTVGVLQAVFDEENKLRDNTETVTSEIHDSWANVPGAIREVIDVHGEFLEAGNLAAAKALEMRDANREAAKSFREDLTDAIAGFVTFFDGAVDEIDTSLKELEAQFKARATQNERFWNGLAILAAAGLDDLVSEIQAQGPAAAGVVEDLVEDMDRAFAWEQRIEESKRQAAAMANALANGLAGETATVGAAFNAFGISLADQLEAGFSTADLGNTLTQLMDLASPSGVNTPRGVKKFHAGGVVPGPRGSERLIMASGGERVVPPGGSVRGGANTTIVVQSPMNNFRSDLQYASILASVTNLVEGF